MYILGCLLLVPVLLLVFYLFGEQFLKYAKISMTMGEQLIVGFFVYFSAFQILAVPLVVLKLPLSVLSGFWCVILVIVLAMSIRTQGWKDRIQSEFLLSPDKGMIILITVFLMLLGIQWIYTMQAGYQGFDTAYYVGNVNTSVYTNTMYIFDPNTGEKLTTMPLRYLLSSYYMHSAVICQLTGLPAVTFMRITTGFICSLLSYSVIYEIGKELLRDQFSLKKGLGILAFAAFIHLNYNTLHSESAFLLQRSYEAKSVCANLLLPAVTWILLRLLHNDTKENWKLAGLLGFANIPVSMSGILIVPVYMTAILVSHILVTRKWGDISRYVLCVIPNAIYLLIYLLGTMNVIVLRI